MSNVTETGGLVSNLAKIEDDEIVIRVPFAAIPYAASLALSEHGYSVDERTAETRITVTDARQFAEDMVRAMNTESEDGTTRVHILLDAAVCIAYENGSEGCHEHVLPSERLAND